MSKTYFNISDKLRLYEFDGMLDQYGDAAAAYSLRKLRNGYTGNAIRVRRSSDNTERDMGFYNNELDTVALLDWVNADHIKYESDFRLGGDNFSTLELQQLNGESIAGEDNAAKFTLTGGLNSHYAYRGPTTIGQTMKVTGRYYIPSTNASCNAIRISGGSSEFIFANTLDEWAEFEHITTATVSYAIFRAANGTNANLDGDGDVFYLKDLVYTQITADGHVHTWYDQSANANHAVQGTATAQPKIVDAGAVVTEGGKPAITMDGVDDTFLLTSSITSTDYSVLTTLNLDDTFQTSSYGGLINESSGSTSGFIYHHGQGYNWRDAGSYHKLVHPVSTTGQHLLFMTVNSTTGNGYINGQLSKTNVSIANNNLTFGELFGDAFGSLIKANVQELVLYTDYRQGEQDDFMGNANTYYEIY